MHADIQRVAPVLGGCVILFIVLMISVLMAVVYCKICAKAGYHWALGLLMFVPVANIILPLILAFGEWPIQKQLNAYKKNIPCPASSVSQGEL